MGGKARCRLWVQTDSSGVLLMPGSTERGKRDSRQLSKVSFHPSLVLGCLLVVSCLLPLYLQLELAGVLWVPWVLPGCSCSCWKVFLIRASLCCCSQPAPHQGPGAQAVGGAAARDRRPADHRGKAAAQRQLVSGGFGMDVEGNPYPDIFYIS